MDDSSSLKLRNDNRPVSEWTQHSPSVPLINARVSSTKDLLLLQARDNIEDSVSESRKKLKAPWSFDSRLVGLLSPASHSPTLQFFQLLETSVGYCKRNRKPFLSRLLESSAVREKRRESTPFAAEKLGHHELTLQHSR